MSLCHPAKEKEGLPVVLEFLQASADMTEAGRDWEELLHAGAPRSLAGTTCAFYRVRTQQIKKEWGLLRIV